MLSKMHTPENCCVEPDHYRKYYRAFFWNSQRLEKKAKKKAAKKDKRRPKSNSLPLSSNPALLSNPSQFAVFSSVRGAILSRWTLIQNMVSDHSDDSDSEDHTLVHANSPYSKLPKITTVGLRTVFALVAQARTMNASFCEHALKAMLDVLQGHAPEDLHQEPSDIILNLHNMLIEVSSGVIPGTSSTVTGGSNATLSNNANPSTSASSSNCNSATASPNRNRRGSPMRHHTASSVVTASAGSNAAVNAGISTNSSSATSTASNTCSDMPTSSSTESPGPTNTGPTPLTAAATSCLLALSVARGDAELMLNAAASLIMSPANLADQNITIPANLMTLQRSVQSVMLGTTSRNCWLNYGVPSQSLYTSFTADLPSELSTSHGEASLVIRSLASDGAYLYLYTSKGLVKVGSGYAGTIKQHMYLYKPDFFPTERHGWLGCCKNKMYVRLGRKKADIYQVNKDSLDIEGIIRLDPGPQPPPDNKSFIFTDGSHLGMLSLTNNDTLSVKMYNPDQLISGIPLAPHQEFCLHLLRNRTVALGWAPFEELERRRVLDPLDPPVASQIEDTDDERIMNISAGQDFALLRTSSGKVYYTGKASSLGYKVASPPNGRWLLMKETTFSRNDPQNAKMSRIVQVAVGHEGAHAILVVDDGSVLFTGMSRRGEDGDIPRQRRQPKPYKPKRLPKVEGHHIIYAACNYGTSALITRQGLLLMYGKDIQHADAAGIVTALRHERIVQVALGKAHAAALTNTGLVYTFGLNNKGQCGRDFGYTKERHGLRTTSQNTLRICDASEHQFTTDDCRICVVCRECTGFSTACQCAEVPDRAPKEKCGCGEGDSGCTVCGVCRRCAKSATDWKEMDDDEEVSGASDSALRSGKDGKYHMYEGSSGSLDTERECKTTSTSLPPARIAVPGGHKIVEIACGLQHTAMLTEHGEVLTFGSNQYGQLGAGNVTAHHRIIRVKIPKSSHVAAGSNHTAALTRDGELYTFGRYQKGALGRQWNEDNMSLRADRAPVWYATPGKVMRLGPSNITKVMWMSASGDQTFVQVSQALLKADTLLNSTVTANKNTIMILPNRSEHLFKCITINKSDGSCRSHAGSEQVNFAHSIACLDPLYDVLWVYQAEPRIFRCYNILVFDTHTLQKCSKREYYDEVTYAGIDDYSYPNYGPMKKIDDFKNIQTIDTICNDTDHKIENSAFLSMSILNQELAIPCVPHNPITRLHAAIHLLGCLDTLYISQETKYNQVQCKCDYMSSPSTPTKDDFMMVNRFESNGGGWGYSGHSVEAIRFMVDTDVLLGGYALFGGRGEYTAKIKLFDLGIEGGDQESDGELLAESDEIVFECLPKEKYPILFEMPIPLVPSRWYVAWATISGPSSDCGSSGQAMVVNEDAIFHFKTSKKSNNGTDVNAGQIPSLLYTPISHDQGSMISRSDNGDTYIILSRKMSRKITLACFRSLITLLQWAWINLKKILMETHNLVPQSYLKLMIMKRQNRLVYIIRACMRIIKFYINEVYPQQPKKRTSANHLIYADVISEVRNILQSIMADETPSCSMISNASKRGVKSKTHRMCNVNFQLDLTDSVLKEAHKTLLGCFYAFFPTPAAKWNHLCSLLIHAKDGVVPAPVIRELTATIASLCVSKSLREILNYVAPVAQHPDDDKHSGNGCAARRKSETRSSTSRSSRPPPVPPRSGRESRNAQPQDITEPRGYLEWNLSDILPRMLDVVMVPTERQMAHGVSNQPHDHGELQRHDDISKYSSKFLARLVSELTFSTDAEVETEVSTSNCYLSTPSRYMRVNQTRGWNTGNGSPDAICFSVDRSGVVLVGVGVYGGLGNYDYELELLHDQLRGATEDTNPAHCWFSVEVTHGTFTPSDCHNEIAQLKFERPIPLKEDVRYAVRFCNHGGRTSNGDCGLPSVKGSDGTTFRFNSCSLSFNGTTLTRGQIPTLLYYAAPMVATTNASSECMDRALAAVRATVLRVSSLIFERTAKMFESLRNEMSQDDFAKNSSILQGCPAVNILIPYTLANLESLNDSKSTVAILEMVHKLLPQVTSANLVVPNNDGPNIMGIPNTTTSQFYTWIESDHPYKQATITNIRALFPSTVTWLVVEMDPSSITAQPEDSLTMYAMATGNKRHHCHCGARQPKDFKGKGMIQKNLQVGVGEPGMYEPVTDESVCLEYNCMYVAVTPKMSNMHSEWPQKSMIIPGNEVIFSLEAATDYLSEYKGTSDESRFGFRALVVGYEDAPITIYKYGLSALEMELAFAGASCAARLLSPAVDIAPLSPATILDFQNSPPIVTSHQDADESRGSFESNEALLLSRGLDISSPPTIDQIMMGHSLSRCQSKSRLFLADLISMAELTAGGRLARWLQPDSRVEPARCDIHLPAGVPRVGTPLLFNVVPRDQHGEQVRSPALKVEMLVQLSESGPGSRQSRRVSQADTRMYGGHPPPPVLEVPYEVVTKENMNFHAISIMKAYQNYSFEEIRAAGDNAGGVSRVPPERLVVRPLIDGTYSATWMPRHAGLYAVECSLDGNCAHQDLSVEVKEQISAGLASSSSSCTANAPRKDPPLLTRPTKLRKFCAADTAGLRVRIHPSLQSEELGVIPPNANIGFTEEVQNNDGTWLRLSHDAVKLYLEANATSAVAVTALSADPPEAWCLQYHQQLDRTLLQPLEAQLFTTKNGDWEVAAKSSNDNNSPTNPAAGEESDNDNDDNEGAILFSSVDLRKAFRDSMRNESDSADESDSSSPFMVPKALTCRAEVMMGDLYSGSMESLSRVDSSTKNMANGNGCSEDWDGSGRSSKSSLEVQNMDEAAMGELPVIDNSGKESRLMQTGTQTSPDNIYESRAPCEEFAKQKDEKTPLKLRTDRKRFFKRSTPSPKGSPPPPRSPFKNSPVKQPPPKYAMSPSQAECYRAVFAALIWHEGVVHDAMACAAYLKFQPNLPKHLQAGRVAGACPEDVHSVVDETSTKGYRVKTRGSSTSGGSGDMASTSKPLQHQRHSVEVSYAGEYMHIQPSTLETLTRSAVNANANRNRNKRVSEATEPPISEEEGTSGGDPGDSNHGVVTVLPPSMRALVAVWDKICEAKEIVVTPEKYMKEDEIEKNLCGIDRKLLNYGHRAKAKKEYRASTTAKTPYSVSCELCNGIAVTPPLAAHMRHTHPGCKAPCSKGYDRSGSYVDAGPALTACGQLAQAYYLWYMYCERCRDKSIKASSTYKQSKPKTFSDSNFERTDTQPSMSREIFDHQIIRENAIFLLDLTPLYGSGDHPGIGSRSPPTPANSMWLPAPEFQSLSSLGVSMYSEDEISEYDARYDLIRRWHALGIGGMYTDLLHGFGVHQYRQNPNLYLPAPPPPSRFHRSVSMGQAGARDLASASEAANLFMRHHDVGHDGMSVNDVCLLTQPSAALLRLIGCTVGGPESHEFIISAVDPPKLDVNYLLNRPALTFIRNKKDLDAIRTKMDAAIRIATVRQYSLEALNWLLRSVTQPTSLHDIMWWFCSALETFSKYEGASENKKNLLMDGVGSTATPSWVVAGGIAGGGRSALHSLLQSIAELMPNLAPCSPALLQAVRCWALDYSPTDHVFLHSVISKILSHTEEDLYEENVVGFLPNESCDNVVTKDGFIWLCTDMTGWCDISVSSRPGMMPALTDGTTETFWESGDEDRNKPKWIQIACPGGVYNEKPHIISLHIDNTRDTANKTLMVSFLYSGNSTELFQMQDVEVDVKTATWISYTLPKNAAPPVRIRCELRGPDSSVRVRQLKVLAVPSLRPNYQVSSQNTSHYKMILERVQPAALILHQNIEMETLRVFRLITSQVFGKLLEWDSGSSSEAGEGSYSRASVGEDANPDDTDLREHVVGILFAGSKLTNLQKQVMSHIVTAIGAEAQKAREEWETALLAEEPDDGSARASPVEPLEPTKQDNYCFEMLSLVLALSGSQVGREHLAKRLELLPDLLSLLHTGSDRVQRQVISLLRRVIGEISPQKMLNALNAGNEGSGLRVTLIDNLVTYVAKAINVQVKVKGFNGGAPGRGDPGPSSPRAPSSITMGSSGIPIPPGFWFMKGQTSKKHAHLVVKLLTDMAEDKLTSPWGAESRSTLASYTVRLAGVPSCERKPGSCVAAPAVWLALGALCVIEESYVELMTPRNSEEGAGASVRSTRSEQVKDSRPYCVNHDDGETLAVIDCRSCGPLCHECDRCLHLNRAARTHHRQMCKEEESTIRVDIHEGCGRAKLFWLLLLIDRRTLKALAEFRGISTDISDEAAGPRVSLPGPPGLAGICRFCGAHSNSGLLAIGNVCADQECQEHSRNSCSRVLACGHLCGGVRDERACLPCLYGCGGGGGGGVEAPALRQDADDMCMICFTDPLAASPSLQLKCGHVFHLHCCKKVLTNKWLGPRITFSFSQCPICKEDMEHAVLEQLLEPVRRLEDEVRRKALIRLEYEGLSTTPAIHTRYRGDVAAYSMDRYAYYVCFKCGKAYYGGQARCDVDAPNVYDPSELLCGACSDVTGARSCPKHGGDFLEYKCRYCCSVAVFFCFGTSHFCNTCHDDFQRVTNIPKHALPHCPAGPKGKQLEGTPDDCPLHISHPPTGEEFALGCGVCRNSQTF